MPTPWTAADIERAKAPAKDPSAAPGRRTPARAAQDAPAAAGAGSGQEKPVRARSAADLAKEQAARAEVVGPGRLAWVNEVFGLSCHYRKYRLLNPADAEALDALFYELIGAHP